MHNKTKGALIGAAIGAGFGGPVGAAVGAFVGGMVCNTDILDEFKDSVKEHVKQYSPDGFTEITPAQWENLYRIQREAHKREEEKYGKGKSSITRSYLRTRVRECLEELQCTGKC